MTAIFHLFGPEKIVLRFFKNVDGSDDPNYQKTAQTTPSGPFFMYGRTLPAASIDSLKCSNLHCFEAYTVSFKTM